LIFWIGQSENHFYFELYDLEGIVLERK